VGSPDRYLSLGYQFDQNDPVVNNGLVTITDPTLSPGDQPFGPNSYGYDGNEVNIGMGWLLPQSVTANASFAYRHERYQELASNGRKDDEYVATVALSRPIMNHLNAIVAYLGDYNNSNQSLFDYDRSIVSVAMEVRF
jgi:hypothetical protein